ncbi:hypothetical protein [Streptomyces sp. NPDC047453]|uniref:hypothetical protein n=1 Tax=Streptomyces sp. NPDC047453 TaxID=3154812 RepID=UPI0033DE5C39
MKKSLVVGVATAGLAGLAILNAPTASAAPPDGCASPKQFNYHVKSKTFGLQYGTTSFGLVACPWQDPTAWTTSNQKDEVGFWGGNLFYGMSTQIKNGAIKQNERWFEVIIELKACPPPFKWFSGEGCFTEARFGRLIHLNRVGDDVRLEETDLPQDAGWGQWGYELSTSHY